MLGILKRIAAIGRAVFRPAARTRPDASMPAAMTAAGSAAEAVQLEREAQMQPWAPCFVSVRLLAVTISKPEPLPSTDCAPQPACEWPANTISATACAAAAGADVTCATAAEKSAATSPRALAYPRREVSPALANRFRGRTLAATRRPKKPVARTPVRSNRAAADQVRMQAALMRSRRSRDAERALSRIKAMLPTATILTLQRAA